MSAFKTDEDRPRVRLLPWGFGSSLQREYGFKFTAPRWSAAALDFDNGPAAIREVIQTYLTAGIEILTVSATFRIHDHINKRAGLPEGKATLDTQEAFTFAREALTNSKRKNVILAASLGPVGDTHDPSLIDISSDELRANYSAQVERFISQKPDFILAETMPSLDEATTAAWACSIATWKKGIPFGISFAIGDRGNLHDGTSIQKAINDTTLNGRRMIGFNCSKIEAIECGVEQLFGTRFKGTVAIYPNGIIGHSRPAEDGVGWIYDHTAATENDVQLADKTITVIQRCIDRGLNVWAGGCCATTPGFFAALKYKLADRGLIPEFREIAGTALVATVAPAPAQGLAKTVAPQRVGALVS